MLAEVNVSVLVCVGAHPKIVHVNKVDVFVVGVIVPPIYYQLLSASYCSLKIQFVT